MPPFVDLDVQPPLENRGYIPSVDEYIQSIVSEFGLNEKSLDIGAFIKDALRPFTLVDILCGNTSQSQTQPHHYRYFCGEEDFFIDDNSQEKRPRRANVFGYKLGNVLQANWYRQFLAQDNRQQTYSCSERNRFGPFHSHFRLTLKKVDALADLFIENGWVRPIQKCADEGTLYVKTQLHIMGALEVLASHTPFRKLQTNTEISTEGHHKFFHKFLDKMYSICNEHIQYHDTFEDLKPIL
jgi:hypothetical protein